MPDHFESGVFTRGLGAWHTLGNVVAEGDPAETDAQDALRKAAMDWTVSMRQAYMSLGGPDEVSLRPIPGVRVIVRDSDNKILGNAGDVPTADARARHQYQVFQNADMAAFFQPILDEGIAKIEAAGSLYGGQRVYMLAKIGHNGDSHADIVPGDTVRNHWLVANSHNGKHSLRIARCRTRVVCANTLAAAFGEGTNVRLRHNANIHDMMIDVRKILVKEQEAFTKDVGLFRALAGKQINKQVIREYVQAVFPESFKEKKETAQEKRDREREESRRLWRAREAQREAAAASGRSLVAELMDAAPKPDETFAEKRAELCSEILDRVSELVENGRGSDIPGVRGTMWGLYNATNEFLQYEYGRGPKGATDKRMDGMLFGAPATWNALALQKAQDFGRG